MKALTLTQPWATLVAIGAKKFETRSWPTKYHGQIAIHAAKGFPKQCQALAFQEPFQSALRGYDRLNLPTGAIVAVAFLVDCFPAEKVALNLGNETFRKCYGTTENEVEFGDYTPGRFAFQLTNVRRLVNPIPAKGMLGLWNTDAVLTAAIEEQLRSMTAAFVK